YIRSTNVELYDPTTDPGETQNLAAGNAQQTRAMEHELAQLESKLVERARTEVQLTEREKRTLASLGYLGGPAAGPREGQSLPDIKDMIGDYEALLEGHRLLNKGDIDRAVQQFQAVTEAAPDYLLAKLFLGDALVKQQHPEAAIALYREILERDPEHAAAR